MSVPVMSEYDRPFWEALRHDEVRIRACLDCGTARAPAEPFCPACTSERTEWALIDGRGEVHSFIWYFRNFDPRPTPDARFDALPYNVSVIALDAGPRLISNVLDVPFGQLQVGQRVKPRFSATESGWALLHFTVDA